MLRLRTSDDWLALAVCEAQPGVTAARRVGDHLEFTADELANIDRYAVDGGIDLWRTPATS